jgi:hypothetical protein
MRRIVLSLSYLFLSLGINLIAQGAEDNALLHEAARLHSVGKYILKTQQPAPAHNDAFQMLVLQYFHAAENMISTWQKAHPEMELPLWMKFVAIENWEQMGSILDTRGRWAHMAISYESALLLLKEAKIELHENLRYLRKIQQKIHQIHRKLIDSYINLQEFETALMHIDAQLKMEDNAHLRQYRNRIEQLLQQQAMALSCSEEIQAIGIARCADAAANL